MNRTDAEIERLATRLADERSRRVVFVSHCLLNQNVRYLGGAWAAGIAPDAVGQFIREGVGLCQMPCPEQAAWGGVMKRFILRFYGAQDTWAYRFCGLLLPVFRLYTRAVYRRLASRTARHIADYARSGFQVIGIVGVGDSPSCGVLHTLNINRSLQAVASIDLNGIDRQTFNERAIQACVVEGGGLYIKALRRQLGRRGLTVPFLEHQPSTLPRS
jgi:predicted secreted protein